MCMTINVLGLMSEQQQLTPCTMEASVASRVVRAPGQLLGSSNQPVSCRSMAWNPALLRRLVRSSPDLAKAYPWRIRVRVRVRVSPNPNPVSAVGVAILTCHGRLELQHTLTHT